MAYVYQHRRNDTSEIFYIGIGKNKNRMYSTNNRNTHWYSIAKKAGYTTEIIEDNLSWEDACKREIFWINHYGRFDLNEGSLTNMTNGGEGFAGNHSEKTKNKMRKPKSEQAKLNMSKARLGKSLSDEIKKNMSKAQLGRVVSDETKEKIRRGHLGRKVSKDGISNMKKAQQKLITQERIEILRKAHLHESKPVSQFDMNGNLINNWESISEASRNIGIGKSKISDCCRHKYGCKSAGGFKWEYR